MVETLLTALSMENHHPSTMLSMDSSASSHDELDLEMTRPIVLPRPPDINLPLSAERSPTPQQWNSKPCEILEAGLAPQIYESESYPNPPKPGKKCVKRVDSIWGAWFFFSFYFKPVLNEKSKAKIVRDVNGVSGFVKSDLQLETFMVQHDMENMYMWVFKERPCNALGKMQLRSFMNGHSRQGERPFPFSTDRGFVRSHRMQRKHYRGLSNPQCVHGIELVPSPNLLCLDEEDRKRWIRLTGREPNFTIPLEASDFGSWRNLPTAEFELERPPSQPKKLLNGSGLNLSSNTSSSDCMDLSPICSKRKNSNGNSNGNGNGSVEYCYLGVNNTSDQLTDAEVHPVEPHWLPDFSGVMKSTYGPVTAAKSIYEDEQGYLIVISLPCVDLQRVKVSWRNVLTHGIIKVSCVSTSRAPLIKRHKRTFKLTDPSPEHCPPGEFIREIPLSTRIPEDANIEAYYDSSGTVLEIMVPKLLVASEEHEEIMPSSGSWPSGCPEKYPWIGGEERIPPWYEQERDMWVEQSSSNVPFGDENRAPLQEIPQPIPPAPEDPRIQQLEDIAMDLTTRVFVAEATAQRTAEELERANELNNQLIDQLATLSNQSVQVWGELLGARSQLETQKWMFFAMTVVALAALARN